MLNSNVINRTISQMNIQVIIPQEFKREIRVHRVVSDSTFFQKKKC